MTKIKRLVAVTVAILMILGSMSIAASAWDAENFGSKDISFTTKIFREVNGQWLETTKVEPGETVKARVYVDTEYYTHSGNLLLFYNTDFFTDNYGAVTNLTVNSHYAASPYAITGSFFSAASTSTVESAQVAAGNITQAYADNHNFFWVSYEFGGALVQQLDASYWLCEFDLNVINTVNTTQRGVFEIVESTILSPTNLGGTINVPKGEPHTSGANVEEMSNWTANVTEVSASVAPFTSLSTVTFNANGGTFTNYAGSSYIAEGDLGDELTPPPAISRNNYTFAGWIDASDPTPTAAEAVPTPETFSGTIAYNAFWSEVVITDNDLSIATKFFRLDPATSEWVETENVARGETVKARVYLDTNYPAAQGQFMLLYDKDFFSDAYGNTMINIGNSGTAFNTAVGTDAADAGVTGEIITNAASTQAANRMIANGLVDQSVFDANNYMLVVFRFDNNELSRLLDSAGQTEWFIELELTVLNDATAMGDIFTLQNAFYSPATSATVRYGYGDIHKYGAGQTLNGSMLSMSYWSADLTLTSQPVSVDSTITLNANGGAFATAPTDVQTLTGYIGEAVPAAPVPSLADSTFMGWAPVGVAATMENVVDLPTVMPYEDEEYNAVWNTEVDITFDYDFFNGGDEAPATVITVTAGTDFEAVEDPERDGYTFISWSLDGETPIDLPDVYPATDTTYYPVWNINSYALIYNVLNPETQSFSAVATNDLNFGNVIPRDIPNYEHLGYTLSEPYTDISFTTPLPVGATMPANNYNIYYRLTAGSWPVTFNANGGYFNGDPADTQEVLSAVFGQQIPTPADPVRPYYNFTGWVPVVGEMDDESKTFEATWDAILYTANYYVDDVLYETYDAEFGESLEYPASPDAPTGYEFVGWQLRSTNVLYLVNEDFDELAALTVLAETMDFDAVFVPIDQTITFDAGDGHFGVDENAHTTTVVAQYDSELVLPEEPVQTGYDFIGWSETEGGTTPIDDPYVIQGDDTLYAIWDVHTWTVTYMVDEDVYAQYDIDFGAPVTRPADPIIEGYNFIGWTPTVATTMPDNDLVYTATTIVKEYTFVLDAGAGKFADTLSVATITQNYGTDIIYPANPVRDGYDFLGWVPDGTVNPTTTNLVIPMPEKMPADPISYDALWAARADTQYTVKIYTMDVTGAYPATPQTTLTLSGTTDTEVTYTPATIPEHFTLSETAPYESVLTGTIVGGDTPLVLTVYFERDQYEIIFDGNGGLINGDATVSADYYYGATVTAPADPVLAGSDFLRWDPTVYATAVAPATYTAQWTATPYTITYYNFDNSVIVTDTYLFGANVTLTSVVPTRTGYTFDDWYVSLDMGAAAFTAPATMPAENLEAFAQFTVNSHDATFTAPDADPAYEETVPVDFGSTIIPPVADPVRPGYTFDGWSEDGETVVTDFGTMPDEDKEYVALWTADEGTFTVNIYRMAADGTYPAAPQTQTYSTPVYCTGDTVTLVSGTHYTVPVGRHLDYTAPDYVTKLTDVMPTNGNITFNVYIALDEQTLTVVVGEDVRQETLRVSQATGVTDPTPPTGYTFAGWVNAQGNAATVPTLMPAADVFLRATWNIINSDITYQLAGGNVAGNEDDIVDSFDYNQVITGTPAPVREGYTFGGWNPEVPTLMPENDVTVEAQWTINQYNATFTAPDADPAYADVVTPVDFGGAITAPAADPARVGYTFTGWSADGGATTTTDFGTMTTAGATFEAVFEANTDTAFTVRVNYVNNLTGLPATRDTSTYSGTTGYTAKIVETAGADENTVYVLFSSIPLLTGYELDTADARNAEPTGIIAPDGSLILNVYYIAQMRTATFNANNGAFADETDTKDVTIPFNTIIPAVEEPTRPGYEFDGWDGGIVFGTTRLMTNRTFNAQWERKQLTVTFDAGNGIFNDDPADHTETFTGDFESPVVFPTDPTREGYTFGGWSEDGENAIDEATYTVPAEDTELTALWNVRQFTVTYYNIDNESVYHQATIDYGASVTATVPATQPPLTGHLPSGWNTEEDGSGNAPAFYATMPAYNLEFYSTYVGESSVSYRLETYDMDINGNYPAAPTSQVSFTDGVVGQTRTINHTERVGFQPDTTHADSKTTGTIVAGETLVLKLFYSRNQNTITTYTNDGNTVIDTYEEVYYNGFSPAIADAPAIDGYEFIGWADAPNATAANVTLPIIMPNEPVDLYAVYAIRSFDAVFAAPTANTPYSETLTFEFNAVITAPATVPVRDGWVFLGWAPDGSNVVVDLTNPEPYGRMTSAGARYHAEWERTDYTVTFSYNERNATGGLDATTTEITSARRDITFGDPIVFPTAPEQQFYVFAGWYEGETEWVAGSTMPARDLNLVARYTRVQVMLMPKNETCDTRIDRTGNALGTDINAEDFRTQPADTEWYIYGIERQANITADDLLNDYIRVQGDGIITFTPIISLNQEMYGTGARVIVTDRVTGDVVETFIIIIFGDVTGDARVDAADITSIRLEYRYETTWSVATSPDYCRYKAIAADIARNGDISVTDFTSIKDVVAQTSDIDQTTGRVHLI